MFFFLFSLTFYSPFHSTPFLFYLAFYHRTSPQPRHNRACCQAPYKDSVNLHISDTTIYCRRRCAGPIAVPCLRSFFALPLPFQAHFTCRILDPYCLGPAYVNPRSTSRQRRASATHFFPLPLFCVLFLSRYSSV